MIEQGPVEGASWGHREDILVGIPARPGSRRPPREVPQHTVLDRSGVGPKRDVVRRQRNPPAGCPEWAPAAEFSCQVAAEHGHVGHRAACRESFRQRQHGPAPAVPGNGIHRRRFRILERRLPSELIDRLIGHPVTEKDNRLVLHSAENISKLSAEWKIRKPRITHLSASGFAAQSHVWYICNGMRVNATVGGLL